MNNDLDKNVGKTKTIEIITTIEYDKDYKIDPDRITSLEDVKEILSSLNLGIKGTPTIISTGGHDINKLKKYLK